MHIGFTGSREGITGRQKAALWVLLCHFYENGGATMFHHGDCLGADNEGFHTAEMLSYWTIAHPPIKDSLRAFTQSAEVREPEDFLVRDRAIVDESDLLIACPNTDYEVLRSGTWATIRYARKMNKPRIILLP